jgi:hypothetical protein
MVICNTTSVINGLMNSMGIFRQAFDTGPSGAVHTSHFATQILIRVENAEHRSGLLITGPDSVAQDADHDATQLTGRTDATAREGWNQAPFSKCQKQRHRLR